MTGKFKMLLSSFILLLIALAVMIPLIINGTIGAVTTRVTETDAGTAVTNGTLTDGTGTFTGSPISLVSGANTVDCTGAGNCVVVLPAGMTGSVATGTMTVTGSPVTLQPGNNTITTEGPTGNITVTMTGGGSAAITLTNSIFGMKITTGIVSVTSGTGGVTPVAFQWDYLTKTLRLRGLGNTTPQTFTTTYRTEDAIAGYAGFGDIGKLIPLLILVGMLGLTGWGTYKEFKNGQG